MRNLTRREFVGFGASAVAVAALVGCSSGGGSASSSSSTLASASRSSEAVAAGNDELTFVTGGPQGTYYEFGTILARHAAGSAGLAIEVFTSDGSKANVEELENGTADLGFCQSDVMSYAYEGTNLFDGAPMNSFSAVACLYDEQVQIVTCRSDIKTVADLKGKRVSIGVPRSGVYFTAIDVLGAYGITEEDITPTYQGFGDSANSLAAGEIDAAFFVAGAPTAAITGLFESTTAFLVPIDDKHASELIDVSLFYTKAAIAGETYPGQDEEVATVAIGAVVLAANTVSDDDVYAFVKDVFDSAADEAASSAHEKYAELSVEKGASITTVPYHPGAARFFDEQGFPVEIA